MPYLRQIYALLPEIEEAVLADLWAAGTVGVQTTSNEDGEVVLEAWFAGGSKPELPARKGVRLEVQDTAPDQDWLAAYREQARPFPVGLTLFIDPREPDEPAPEKEEVPHGRHLLRLPARTAFGIGSHESTSLAVELLEEMDLRGRRVLDVGTGTGILAFAALLRGAAEAVALDNDPAAVFQARANGRLNHLRLHLFAGGPAALEEARRFDLVLVNIIPEEIGPEMPALAGLLRADGEMILSGILEERGGEVLKGLRALGLVEERRRMDGEWVAFRMKGPS